MTVKATHPLYDAMTKAWELCRRSYDGQDAIKNEGVTYLPSTSGQREDGQGKGSTQPGELDYQAYKMRAVYPDIYREAVETAIGMMHRKEPSIELPASMGSMRERATSLGESLPMLLRRINVQQLTTGRLGLLGDFRVSNGVVRPLISVYHELAIRNWQDSSTDEENVSLNFVVLDESTHVMDSNFRWAHKERYRVLALATLTEAGAFELGGDSAVYATAVFDGDAMIDFNQFAAPEHMGSKLTSIPFSFINSRDISPVPDLPPHLGLANLCLAIYRGEADYRQSLFMQGQDTLVEIGNMGSDEDETRRTGTGARINVPQGGDAKFIGVNSQGLPEQRQALENDYLRAAERGGKLLNATSRSGESGNALQIRVSAQTATLPQIARSGASGLEQTLRSVAEWFGSDPDQVSVEPNLDFADGDLDGQTLVSIAQAKTLGVKISDESIHEWMLDHGATKVSYEDELARLSLETPEV